MTLRRIWLRTKVLVPGTKEARDAGCQCPYQPGAEAWGKSRRTGRAYLVTVSDTCPIHKDTA